MNEVVMVAVVDGLEQLLQLSEGSPVHRQQEHHSGQGTLAQRVGNVLESDPRVPAQGAQATDAVIIQPPGLRET